MNLNPDENGLITKIWGPHAWVTLHSIAYCYPTNPTNIDKEKYNNFYNLVGDVLPCFYCRDSYKEFIKNGNTKLDNNVLNNRESLTKWLYYVHEAVNKKLGVDYGVSYEDVTTRYNSYRASCTKSDAIEIKKQDVTTSKGCDAPIDRKTISYRVENTKDCPIIPLKMAKQFIKYAQLRKLDNSEFEIINGLTNDCKQNVELWNRRNIECCDIMTNMRLHGIKSVEADGQWKDLPTIDEIKLILRVSSNISIGKLTEMVQNLPNHDYRKIYKLVE